MVEITEEMVNAVSFEMARGWRGNPHMSGDDRNFMPAGQRDRHDRRCRAALTAVLPIIGEEFAKIADELKAKMQDACLTGLPQQALQRESMANAAERIAISIRQAGGVK